MGTTLICHRKNGLGNNGLAGPFLDEKLIQLDYFWLTKNDLAGLILNPLIPLRQLFELYPQIYHYEDYIP